MTEALEAAKAAETKAREAYLEATWERRRCEKEYEEIKRLYLG